MYKTYKSVLVFVFCILLSTKLYGSGQEWSETISNLVTAAHASTCDYMWWQPGGSYLPSAKDVVSGGCSGSLTNCNLLYTNTYSYDAGEGTSVSARATGEYHHTFVPCYSAGGTFVWDMSDWQYISDYDYSTVMTASNANCIARNKNYFYPLGPPVYDNESCWAGWFIDISTGQIYWVGTGDCYADLQPDDPPCELLGTCPTPSPTPTPVPSPTPIPVGTYDPTYSPEPSPTPIVIPTVYPNPSPHTIQGDIDLGESGTGTVSLEVRDGSYYIDHTYDESFAERKIQLPEGETSYVDKAVDVYLDQVTDTFDHRKSFFKQVVNSFYDMMLGHPLITFFDLDTSSEDSVCTIEFVLYGEEIVWSFCEWEDYLNVFGNILLGVVSFYCVILLFSRG